MGRLECTSSVAHGLDASKVTSCDSFIDQLQTVYSKCAKSDVCS
jgi:hypothetical protein